MHCTQTPKGTCFLYGVQVSCESPEEAKERAKEACQKRLASAIEAGELEPLREAIDAADRAGCSTSLLKQARSRRDALRKAARRLERQAAGAQCEEEARQQRERRVTLTLTRTLTLTLTLTLILALTLTPTLTLRPGCRSRTRRARWVRRAG